MDRQRFDAGEAKRRAVLGDDYVDKSARNTTDFDRAYREMVTEVCWGIAWADPALEPQQRSLLNLGMIAAQGRFHEFETHFRGAIRNGLTQDQLRSALMQIA